MASNLERSAATRSVASRFSTVTKVGEIPDRTNLYRFHCLLVEMKEKVLLVIDSAVPNKVQHTAATAMTKAIFDGAQADIYSDSFVEKRTIVPDVEKALMIKSVCDLIQGLRDILPALDEPKKESSE